MVSLLAGSVWRSCGGRPSAGLWHSSTWRLCKVLDATTPANRGGDRQSLERLLDPPEVRLLPAFIWVVPAREATISFGNLLPTGRARKAKRRKVFQLRIGERWRTANAAQGRRLASEVSAASLPGGDQRCIAVDQKHAGGEGADAALFVGGLVACPWRRSQLDVLADIDERRGR